MVIDIISSILLILGLGGMLGNVAWVLRKGNNNRLTCLFTGCQLSIVLWLISQLLIIFSAVRQQLWISYIIGNIGISFFAPLWLMFSAEFIGAKTTVNRSFKLLPVISVSSICFIVTNPVHRLYYASFEMNRISYAPLFYIYQVIYYICIIAGITMICIKYAREYNRITKQAILLTLSTAVPLAINTLSVMRIIKSKIELTPLFFAFSSTMIFIAMSRYGFLNINSIAIRDTIDNIESGVIIFDANGNMSFLNNYADRLFGLGNTFTISEFTDKVSEISDKKLNGDFTSAEIKANGEYLNLKQSFCQNKDGAIVARVITINNVTEYYELADAEKKLSIEQERNRIAQDIHDSAGHTFTMISSLAKIAAFGLKKTNFNTEEILAGIAEIDGLSRSGVTQLRCSINNLREDEFMTSVTKALKTITDAVRNIEIDLCIQGDEDERYVFCIKEVYDSCRETITNAVRYADAERIDIIVKFLGERLEVYIFDNGKGCAKITENNGLRGIRERTERLGGTVRFSSVEGEGFTTIIKIPIREDSDL